MPYTVRQPFDPRGEYVARRSFVCNGHKFEAGDIFPWRKLSIDQRKLHRLWEHKFVVLKSEQGIKPKSDKLPEPVEESDTSDELDEDEDSDMDDSDGDNGDEGFIFDPNIHTLDHPDTGQWLILRGGETVLKVERKEWKRLEKQTKPTRVKMDKVLSED